jgi:formylmethanofuran dehydrogenase subunit B
VEDARAAVALADRLGALVVTEDVDGPWPGAPALPLRGSTTATLGEIRDRSRVVVIWREDPETTHPRLLERLGFARDVPRTLIVIDDRDTPTLRRADVRLLCPPELTLEALVTLHALHLGLEPAPGEVGEQMRTVLEHIAAVPHVAFVYGAGLTRGEGGQRRALALHELTRALSHDRHVVTLALARAAGTTGAQDALAWQTGYAGTVDFAGGHPELLVATHPTEDVDVALGVGGAAGPLPAGAIRIEVGSEAAPESAVSIRTAAPGVEAPGTAHRLDGVPLALQAPLAGDAPTAAAVLERLLAEVAR